MGRGVSIELPGHGTSPRRAETRSRYDHFLLGQLRWGNTAVGSSSVGETFPIVLNILSDIYTDDGSTHRAFFVQGISSMSSVPPSPQAPSPRSQTDCPSLPLNPSKLVEKIALGEQPADIDIPDNYVAYTLRKERELPPLTWSNFYTRFNYVSLIALTATPAIAIYGICTTKLRWETALFAIFYYFITGLGTSFLYLLSSVWEWERPEGSLVCFLYLSHCHTLGEYIE